MNNHALIREKLILAAAGTLGAAEYRQVQQHTALCDTCRLELERWSLYVQSLKKIPHASIPAGLAERTQQKMMAAGAARPRNRKEAGANPWTLAAVAAFGWCSSYAFWSVVELMTGFNAVQGFLASTALAWLTAGSVVVMLGHWPRTGRTS
jgi:hypothetical protein